MSKQIPEIRFKEFTDEWEQRKLSNVIKKLSGGASIKPTDYLEEGIRTIPKGAVNDTGIADLSGSKYISKKFFEKNKTSHVSTNCIVTSLRDLVPSAPNMGRIVRIEGDDEQFLLPQGVYKLGLFEGMNEDFLISFSNSETYRKIISAEKSGSTQVHIRNGEFLNIDIKIPPKSEQNEVGAFFKRMDTLITLHQAAIQRQQDLKKAMLQKLFPIDGITIPTVRFSSFSEEWEQRKLKEIVDVRSGKDYKHLNVGDIPVYGTGGFMLGVDEALSYNEDAIGIGRKGTINKPYLLKAPFWTVDTLFYSVPINDTNLFFVNNIFQRINWKIYDESTGVPSLSKSVINEISLMCPKLEEQTKIGIFFKQLENTITLHQQALEKIKLLKQSLLQKMFVN